MRFANIFNSSLILCFLSLQGGQDVQKAEASTAWKILGQPVLTLEYTDDVATTRIGKFNQRLSEILPRLNPNQNWSVDIVITKVPKSKPERIKSALIRLQRYNLIFISEEDAAIHGASSVQDLANSWARALSNIFSQPRVRQILVFALALPTEINYGGVTYYIKPEIAGDRGLFRTSGKRVDGRVVYWEVPADNKAYEISADSTYKSLEPTALNVIYILKRNRQFIPYTRQRN